MHDCRSAETLYKPVKMKAPKCSFISLFQLRKGSHQPFHSEIIKIYFNTVIVVLGHNGDNGTFPELFMENPYPRLQKHIQIIGCERMRCSSSCQAGSLRFEDAPGSYMFFSPIVNRSPDLIQNWRRFYVVSKQLLILKGR